MSKHVNYISNCLPFDSKPIRFYKTKILPTFNIQHPVNSTIKELITIMALTYLKKYKNNINLDIQDRAIINFTNAKQQDLNGFLLHCIVYYKDSKYDNTMLQYCIKEDFVRQIKEIQVPVNKDIIQDFHNFLQEYGVFIPIDRGVIRDNIQEYVINIKEEYKWTL